MNEELLKQAQQPGSMPLRELASAARTDVVEVLTAALVYPAALELADALEGEPMRQLREEAAPYLKAVAEAREALTAERKSVHARLAAFFSSPQRGEPGDREQPPASDTPRVQELQAALSAAEQAATPAESKVRALGYKIDELRTAPAPDRAVLAVLAEALIGGHRDPE